MLLQISASACLIRLVEIYVARGSEAVMRTYSEGCEIFLSWKDKNKKKFLSCKERLPKICRLGADSLSGSGNVRYENCAASCRKHCRFSEQRVPLFPLACASCRRRQEGSVWVAVRFFLFRYALQGSLGFRVHLWTLFLLYFRDFDM